MSLEAFGAKVAVELAAPTEGIKASNTLDALELQLAGALGNLKCSAKHDRFLLVVDQVEKVWSNDTDSDKMAIGLLLAAKHVAARFQPSVNCVLLLRTDIYDLLQFQDRDKFRGDEMRIDWDRSSLRELARRRARASTGGDLTDDDLWNRIFPDRIDGALSHEYLIDHTLMRPRDLIQLCNLCRDTAEKNLHRTIEVSDVHEAQAQYSNWKLQDLISEYRINYPFLAELFVLFQSSSYHTSRQGLEARLTSVKNGLATRYPEFSNTFNVPDVLDILYNIGFLGVLRDGMPKYAFSDPKRLQLTDRRFVIHTAFREALRSTSGLIVTIRPPPRRISEFVSEVEVSMQGSDFPQTRGHAPSRLARAQYLILERVSIEAVDADLPPDVRRELRVILSTVRGRLTDATTLGDYELQDYSTEIALSMS